MAVAAEPRSRSVPARRRFRLPGGIDRRFLLIALGATLAILALRLPSFFEPPWHTDEGIFAAVAYRVLHGGELYTDAWESKPPLFLFLYTAIFKAFGVGVLPLRIAATAFAIGTQWSLYAVARRSMSRGQALLASLVCGVLVGVPFWEGTLALTEVFALLPSVLGVLLALHWESRREWAGAWRWLVVAGALFGAAFLLRQTAALVCVGFVLWLLLSGRPWFKGSLLLGGGAFGVILTSVGAFALFGSFEWFWNANVGFFFHYVGSGREIPIYYRPLIVSPVIAVCAGLAVYRLRGLDPVWSLPALWLSLTLSAALLTGRPYSHYFLQVAPPLALLVGLLASRASLTWQPRWEHVPALALTASILALWLGVVRPEFHGDLLARHYTKSFDYYSNFASWAAGSRSTAAYNDYFDRRVNLTLRLDALLESLGARGEEVYIWGEYPWVYPLAGVEPSTRYMTSFYVLLIPRLDGALEGTLAAEDPRYIVTLADARISLVQSSPVLRKRYTVAMSGINDLIERRYEEVASVDKARVFRRVAERPETLPSSEETPTILEQETAVEDPMADESAELAEGGR